MITIITNSYLTTGRYKNKRDVSCTVQQVLRTQVDVDAAVEAGDETVEDPFLQTQTWEMVNINVHNNFFQLDIVAPC